MKILLLGKNGQVGWELQRALVPLGEIVALDRRSNLRADLLQPEGLRDTVRRVAPDVIVNAAAYTAVDRAESERDLAFAVNAMAPAVLATEAASCGAFLVHYSTDYVFDGTGSVPWHEDSPTGPLNVYGQSKLAGEQAVRSSGCLHLIFRTSWVYAARGSNFLKTMLRLASERETLSVVSDQYGAPTGAELIADVTAAAVRSLRERNSLSGTYHLAAEGVTSWHGYARHAISVARSLGASIRVADEDIGAVTTSAFPTPARRPANSRLATTRLRQAFGVSLPAWQDGVARTIDELVRA